jgi:hypothetical protein
LIAAVEEDERDGVAMEREAIVAGLDARLWVGE